MKKFIVFKLAKVVSLFGGQRIILFILPVLFVFCSEAPRILPTPTNRIVLAEFFTQDG